ncbi:S41 family peptidase [Allosphingosinicella flava]|uniref:S41 family peptidase n=1 Tax=Allosphingosinicella flava TaxID=2771430 RepID=A0A7T2GLA4_9SPHN|nr:S41 family peptidase [Sphingosinicella flava]QPQ55951.1 S41 family peptidase [Sphingosinicella flava]
MKYLAAIFLATAAAAPAAQQASPAAAPAPSAAFNAAEARQAVETLATRLEADFVFPETGQSYAKMLRKNLASGAYDAFPDARAFADKVTEDLRAIYYDGHLRLRPPPAPDAAPAGQQARRGSPPVGIQKAGWIAPDIAYISFDAFQGDEPTLARLRQFLTDHGGAKTLIVDARAHRGGGLNEMDVLFPALYAKPTTLVQMDTRLAVEQASRGALQDGPNLKRIAGPDTVVRREHKVVPAGQASGLRTAKVYLLVSPRTASAGEHLALSLKRTGRATLIGETTAGAGHFGNDADLGGGYRAFIPVGRTFDPETGEGWEGIGVAPDVEVPAEQALIETLVRSGVARADAERLSKEFGPSTPMTRIAPLRK